jgi:predicted MFS family arabinose efflux permease
MILKPYRRVLALPGIRTLFLVAVIARIPNTMAGIALTLYVVLELERGYAAAGLVGTALTVGAALGAPLMGRLVDRRGLRPMLILTTVAEAVFWTSAQSLPYLALLGAALVGGLLTLPVFSVIRQSLAALVPEEQRRPAYALDSMLVELSFMVGPALAVLLATAVSPRLTMLAIGVGMVGSGIALLVLDPPVRTDGEPMPASAAPRRREWLTPRLLALLAMASVGTMVLAGTDVAVVASLRESGQVGWTGVVLGIWAGCSLLGGFAYGALPRPVAPLLLVALLGLTTMPVGLAGAQWWWLALALLPAGALCAPLIAASTDEVSRLAPEQVRGEAMGLHGSAVTIGVAVGAPLGGAVIDAAGASWGFAVIGLIGALVALALLPIELRHRRAGTTADPVPARVPVG